MNSFTEIIDLKNKNIVITGGAGKIGYVIADALMELGGNVILVDKLESQLEVMASILQKRWGGDVITHVTDLEIEKERLDLIGGLSESLEKIDVFINNAAFLADTKLDGWLNKFGDQSLVAWRRAIEVNLTAPFHLIQSLTPLFKKSNSCSIINIGSIYGHLAPDWSLYEDTDMGNPAAYAVSKAGLIQLTRWLSTTLAPQIRVNAIAPGGVFRGQPIQFIKKYESKTPLARMAGEDDLRGAIIFLASKMSEYVTGQVIMVDGGFSVW